MILNWQTFNVDVFLFKKLENSKLSNFSALHDFKLEGFQILIFRILKPFILSKKKKEQKFCGNTAVHLSVEFLHYIIFGDKKSEKCEKILRKLSRKMDNRISAEFLLFFLLESFEIRCV